MADEVRGFAAALVSESASAVAALSHPDLLDALGQAAEALAARIADGATVLTFGNGGSASEAAHLAAELVGRCRVDRRPIPSLALAESGTTTTALANDYGFEDVFARQVEAFGRPGDVAVAFTTSGRSQNVVAGLRRARERGLVTIVLTGEHAETVSPYSDHVLRAPASTTPRVQECHQVWVHALAEWAELRLPR